jgi:hypothetical protein
MCGCAVSLRHGAFSDSAEVRKIRMGRHLQSCSMTAKTPHIPALAVKYALHGKKKWLPFGETRIIRGIKNH